MAKKSLLLVDADPRSLRVLEVSLRKAGYSVATCRDAPSALSTVELSQPDLILSDTRLPGENGFELVEGLRKHDEHKAIPFMFLSSDSSVESKVRGLELGVEDYLVKPIYIKEIITRINLTLQRQEREGLQRRTSISKTRFTGSLGDMGLVDLFQTVEISRKSGVLELTNGGQRGTVMFREGQLVDAELGRLRAEAAIYRLLLWNEGEFEIDFRPVRAEQRIVSSTQALLMEGMRRIDEWGRLLEQIPSLDNVFEVSDDELVERLAEIPDEINEILRHIDGRRSLMQAVDACDGDDLETLTAITKLYFEGIIYPTGRTAGEGDDDRLLDEELVPGEESASVVPGADDEDVPSLVPRTPTEPPPSSNGVDRAKPNAVVHGNAQDVSERADAVDPSPPQAEGEAGQPVLGTDAAPDAAHGEPAGDRAVLDAGPSGAGPLDAGPTSDDTNHPEPEAPDEDGMNKKGRRRRKMRAKAAQEAEPRQEQEASSNVIQFPAQAKRAVTSSSVAVNDDVGVSSVEETVEAPEAAAEPAPAVAKDETQAAEPPAEPAKPEEPEVEAKAEPQEPEAEPAAEAKGAEQVEEAAAEAKEARDAEEPAAEAKEPEPEVKAEAKAPEPEAKAEPAPAARESRPHGKRRKKKKGKGGSVPPASKSVEAKPAEEAAEPASKPAAATAAETKPAETKPAEKSKAAESSEPAPKKSSTTSQEIEAVTATGEHQAIAEDFFRTSDTIGQAQEENWDDLQKDVLPVSPSVKRAKQATFAIVGVGLVLFAGFFLYSKVIMPTPAELSGATHPPEMPDGFAAEQTEPAEPEPATQVAQADEPEAAEAPPAVATEEAEAAEAETAEEATAAATEEAEVAEAEAAAAEAATEEAETAEATAEAAPAEAEPAAAEDSADLASQAMRALNRGRNDDAAGLAQRSVAADPTNALGWLVLGAARQANRDAEGARAAYQSCVDQGAAQQYVRECRALLR